MWIIFFIIIQKIFRNIIIIALLITHTFDIFLNFIYKTLRIRNQNRRMWRNYKLAPPLDKLVHSRNQTHLSNRRQSRFRFIQYIYIPFLPNLFIIRAKKDSHTIHHEATFHHNPSKNPLESPYSTHQY